MHYVVGPGALSSPPLLWSENIKILNKNAFLTTFLKFQGVMAQAVAKPELTLLKST